MKPREYQQEAIDSVYKYFEEGNKGNPLIAAPTGTGKSIIVGELCGGIVSKWPSQRLMMITHVKELIEQNHSKFKTMYPCISVGIYSAGLKRKDSYQNVIFSGIQSVAKKAHEFGKIDLIIIDECHLVSPNAEASYGKFIDTLMLVNPHLKVIGLTATPYRLGLGLMTNGQIFDDIVYDKTQGDDFVWFIEQGYLSPLIPKPTKTSFDLEGVKKRGGEFISKDLQDVCAKTEITRSAVEETIGFGTEQKRKRWMVFTTGKEHCIQACEMLLEYGIDARAVYTGMPGGGTQREETINWFKQYDNSIKVLVNVDTLTTGFDCPELDLLAILRPTNSPGLWVQILGRGTRPAYAENYDLSTAESRLAAIKAGPKQNCMVLDFAANTMRLGPINRVAVPEPKKKTGGDPPAKICPECDTIVYAAAQFCEYCGHEFPPPKVKLTSQASNQTLIAGQETEIQVMEYVVDKVFYSLHTSRRKTRSLKVRYFCSHEHFDEYISLENDINSWPRQRSIIWWGERAHMHWLEVPDNIEAALVHINNGALKTPTRINVRVDVKHPEILKAYDYE